MLKKLLIKLALFAFGFVLCYLFIGYIPAFRIKLAADGATYFWTNLRHGAMLKSMASVIVGLVLSFVPNMVEANQELS